MKKYKHLVFDIDGTMIDSLPVHMVSLIKTLREGIYRGGAEIYLWYPGRRNDAAAGYFGSGCGGGALA